MTQVATAPSPTPPASKTMLWTGRVLGVLPIPLLLLSAAMKFMLPPEAAKGFAEMGWRQEQALGLGILELACVVVYLIPQTAVLGAILLTGYLGGAIATHMRITDYPGVTIPVIMGILIWLGLYLRDSRLRALIPLRS